MEQKRAMIAMSGGVDSSVAAYLMKERGMQCIGVTMKLYDNEDIGMDREKTCCSLSDTLDAENVARSLGIPYYVFNMKDSFQEKVVCHFVDSYIEGRTPNPCIDCNRYLKFEGLMRKAAELHYDYVVTGHYARVEQDPETGRYLLRKGADESKDQSYVLYNLTQEQLAHVMFPLGDYTKPEIRKIAEEQGFVNADKKDSQDICFIPDGDYAAFIERFSGKTWPEGDFVRPDGTVVGKHKGLIRYTIGQRRGLGIAAPRPLYVCGKDLENNRVIVGEDQEIRKNFLDAKDLNLIAVSRIEGELRCAVKIRYHAKDAMATVTQTGEDSLHIEFDESLRGITPGQSVVLYDGDLVIGGGTIV